MHTHTHTLTTVHVAFWTKVQQKKVVRSNISKVCYLSAIVTINTAGLCPLRSNWRFKQSGTLMQGVQGG